MDSTPPRSGYTLPVFACAAAIAALRWLRQDVTSLSEVSVHLIEPAQTATIPIEQVARLTANSALAITRSDPGDNLDLTRHTPVWAVVERNVPDQTEPIVLLGGDGIGQRVDAGSQPAIYAYARRLLQENLAGWLQANETVRVTIILPEGKALAERTSNAAFGVVEGLSLLGTSGIAHPLSAPGQLDLFRAELRQKANLHDGLVFCIGENGLDLALRSGIPADRLIKTANWLGSLLVEAGIQGVSRVLLFGYHGKLMKLAGGIFHTHHHVADGRHEILAAHCANQGLPTAEVQAVFNSATAEAALSHLRLLDAEGSRWVEQVYGAIARQIEQRSQDYIRTHSDRTVAVGAILFDRDRRIITRGKTAVELLPHL
ncbi:cobalt-precorrin-5B (C(1))-methyltransferase [Oculatella sp. LEGE 06141]|uniref:cobalt-precorrin-5B (C(1))-methyltransferase CbiD n=1 Tax=Oculatella sp. LEGE 06141 TaxID=1828648 RepID=UPI00188281B1|nr:cobalt-precorrin-5B (C(1))-methyltransferase [Oculatella sp. LEGE 06141]